VNKNTNVTGSEFTRLGVAPSISTALTNLKIITPTPIQRQAIPVALQGKDLVGVAQTGTGKTLAFGLPMIQRLNQVNGQGLIILPTRELAIQVDEELRKVAGKLGLKTAVLIGGTNQRPQVKALNQRPHIIVATPGRLNDLLEQKVVRLNQIKIAVLDEADRMLDMGFAPQIRKVFQHLPADRQTMLFSATLAPEIMKMATNYLKIPIRIEVAPAGTVAANLTQEIFIISKLDKVRLVDKLLEQYHGSTLVFTRTKFGAKKLARSIRDMGHTAAEIHSNRSLSQRQDAIQGFKSGKYRILVATDIASRGIDVSGIELVLNFDLPTNAEDYVHRIGRTARAGGSGHAISLATPDQRHDLRDIEKLIKKNIDISPLPPLPANRPSLAPISRDPQDFRSNRGSSRFQGRRSSNSRQSKFSSRPPRRGRPSRFSH